MLRFRVSKYKIIITLILFCFFQTTPSISFEIKLKIPKDLKKLGDKVKKEIEKKEPEVKKEEVKKEEVKKEKVPKDDFYTRRERLKSKDVVIIWEWAEGRDATFQIVKQERTVKSDLPNCREPQPTTGGRPRVYWDNCFGIKLMDQGEDKIFGNDEIVKYEGEFNKTMWNGKGRMTWEDGGIREGVFKDNDLVSSETMPELAEGYSDRFKDCYEVLKRGLNGDEFCYSGKYFNTNRKIKIRPTPNTE